jgi:transcriptional regulator with XRE-family HTH domain
MVGEEIRRLRVQQGITVNRLAETVGLSPSAVSQIERGVVDPSLRSLRSIAEALDTPVFSLFLEAPRQNIVVRNNQRRSFTPIDHTATYELVTPDLNRRLEMLVMYLDPGTASSDQPLAHAGDECLMVLQGKAQVTVANEQHDLAEGDSIYLNEGVPHVVANMGVRELVCVAAITPAVF